MLPPITLSPDDLARVPIPKLVRDAALSADRAMRLTDCKRAHPGAAVDAVLAREWELIRVRMVALRCRAGAVAHYLRAHLRCNVDADMVRRDHVLVCLAAFRAIGELARD